MNGTKLSRLILHRAFATGLLTIFAMTSPSLISGAEEIIKIHAAAQWKVGEDTIQMMTSISSKWGKYAFLTIGKEPVNSIIKPTRGYEIDVAILTRNQWFKVLNEGHPIAAVAEMGPYIAVVNENVFQRNKANISEFLENWQNAWLKTDYPYGVQPPEIAFLNKKYNDFIKEQGLLQAEDISPFTKILIKRIPVKVTPGKALVISREYYASIGLNVRSLTISKRGETYEGRIMEEFSGYIELDKNPCELDLVNIEKPYDKLKTVKTKYCESKEWDIYKVMKK
jgi:hypothetical protein